MAPARGAAGARARDTGRDGEDALHPAFAAALVALGLAVAGLWLSVALRSSFAREDWQLLGLAQQAGFDPWGALLPAGPQVFWAYRPLGVDMYFQGLHTLFGVDVRPFLVVALLAHALRGVASYFVLRALAVPAPLAAAASLFATTLWPGLDRALYPTTYHYVGAAAFGVAALAAWLGFLRGRRRAARAGALLALALALLHSEAAVSWAAVLALASAFFDPRAGEVGRWRRTARDLAPVAALVVAYLLVRELWSPNAPPPAYVDAEPSPRLALRWLVHTGVLLRDLATRPPTLLALLALGLVGLASRWRGPRRGDGRGGSLRVVGFGAASVLATTAPFALLVVSASRFGVGLEVPLAIALAGALAPLWRAARPGLREASCVAALAACLPWSSLAAHVAHPPSEPSLRMVRSLAPIASELPTGRLLLVHYGAAELAVPATQQRARRASWGPWMARSLLPEKQLRMRYVNLRRVEPESCPRCVLLELRPDLTFRPTTLGRLRELRMRSPDDAGPGA